MILSNITTPLLGLVDTAVIGHLEHAYYLGGSTVGAMLITFITWLCGFLRMSTTGLSAHAYGAQNDEQGFDILSRGLFVAIVIGGLLILLQHFYLQAGLWLAGGSEQVQFYAKEYAQVRIWGLPAALGNIVIVGWLLGQHKAKAVMWLLIATNLINLVLDVVFVVFLDWQVRGIAFATLTAECSGFLLGGYLVLQQLGLSLKRCVDKLNERMRFVIEKQHLLRYFHLNKDILIRTLCLEICFVFMTFQGAKLGDDIVAANAILMNLLLLLSFGLDGVANAAEVLVGKAKGGNKPKEIRDIVKLSLFWTLVFAVCYCFVFIVAEDVLIYALSSIPSVIETTKTYFFWLALLPIIGCWCYLFDGVYVGLINARIMRNSMLIATFGCFFPVWFMLSDYQNHGLWMAFCCFMVARGVTLMWHFFKIELRTIES